MRESGRLLPAFAESNRDEPDYPSYEDEEPYDSSGDPYAADASEQDPDGDDLDGDLYDLAVMDEVDNNQ